MAKKNMTNNGEQKKEKENGRVTVVLEADCEGCASDASKCINRFFNEGVETVKTDGQKITVVGKVDPVKLREKVKQEINKNLVLISTEPKTDVDNQQNAKRKESSGGDIGKQKESESKDNNDKSDQKTSKEKEPPVTTAVLKVNLRGNEYVQKISNTVTKTKGYGKMKIDEQKGLVTVTGAMDMKALAELLQKQLKEDVEIVPPKKNNGEGNKGKGRCDNGGGDGGDECGSCVEAVVAPLEYEERLAQAWGEVRKFGEENARLKCRLQRTENYLKAMKEQRDHERSTGTFFLQSDAGHRHMANLRDAASSAIQYYMETSEYRTMFEGWTMSFYDEIVKKYQKVLRDTGHVPEDVIQLPGSYKPRWP